MLAKAVEVLVSNDVTTSEVVYVATDTLVVVVVAGIILPTV